MKHIPLTGLDTGSDNEDDPAVIPQQTGGDCEGADEDDESDAVAGPKVLACVKHKQNQIVELTRCVNTVQLIHSSFHHHQSTQWVFFHRCRIPTAGGCDRGEHYACLCTLSFFFIVFNLLPKYSPLLTFV
jgi:hypothetical protein